jgi:hypothetical protein
MKNIIYRLKFIIEESTDKSKTRNDRLTSLLSTLEDIDTEQPISAPHVNSIIEIDSEEFVVSKKNFSFLNEGDSVFYTTIVYLKKKEDPKPKEDTDYAELIKKFLSTKNSTYKDDYDNYFDNLEIPKYQKNWLSEKKIP